MDVYGLTGGIGSGKSAVAELLEDYGIPVVSADELSRVVVAAGSEGLSEVVKAFGAEVLDERGELDRRKMASIVFRDPARRQQLEAILHPRIRERFEQVLDALEKAGHPIAVYEVPLLFEKNLQSDMKATILVTASAATRVARVMERDQVTEGEIRDRIGAQMPEEIKRRRADYIIENDGSVDELRREVRFMLERFLRFDARTHGPPPTSGASEVASGITEVPTSSPSKTSTEVPTEGASQPSSGGAQPNLDPAPEPPAPPPGAQVPSPSRAPSPSPPPGLNVPSPPPGPARRPDAPGRTTQPAPVRPPSSHPTEPAIPITRTQKAPAVRKEDLGDDEDA